MTLRHQTSPIARRKQSQKYASLIGRRVRVLFSACKDAQGLEGMVLDETKNTVVLETANGRKRVPKCNSSFQIA